MLHSHQSTRFVLEQVCGWNLWRKKSRIEGTLLMAMRSPKGIMEGFEDQGWVEFGLDYWMY